MANQLTATVTDGNKLNASATWSLTSSERNLNVTEHQLVIQYKPSTSSSWFIFVNGSVNFNKNAEAAASRTNVAGNNNTTYDFRLLHYYTYTTGGGGDPL